MLGRKKCHLYYAEKCNVLKKNITCDIHKRHTNKHNFQSLYFLLTFLLFSCVLYYYCAYGAVRESLIFSCKFTSVDGCVLKFISTDNFLYL